MSEKVWVYTVKCPCAPQAMTEIYGVQNNAVLEIPSFRCVRCGCEPRIISSVWDRPVLSESSPPTPIITYADSAELRRCTNKKCGQWYRVVEGHTCEPTLEVAG